MANQGDAERLSKMLPTERKAMVDKLIGADQIESIASWCGEQALGLSREIHGLESGLGAEPVQPVKPEGYRPAGELHELVRQLRDAADAVVRAEAFLANEPVVPVVGPAPTDIPLATLEKADQILGLRTYDFDLAEAELAAVALKQWEDGSGSSSATSPAPPSPRRRSRSRPARRPHAGPRPATSDAGDPLPLWEAVHTADAEIARIEAEIDAIPVLKGVYNLAEEAAALKRWTPEVLGQWQELEHVQPAAELVHDPREAKGAVHVDDVQKALYELGVTGKSRMEIQLLAGELRAYQAVCAARTPAPPATRPGSSRRSRFERRWPPRAPSPRRSAWPRLRPCSARSRSTTPSSRPTSRPSPPGRRAATGSPISGASWRAGATASRP